MRVSPPMSLSRRQFLRRAAAASAGLVALLSFGATAAQSTRRERTRLAVYNPSAKSLAAAYADAGNPSDLLIVRHTARGWRAYAPDTPVRRLSDFVEGPYILSSERPADLDRFIRANDLSASRRAGSVRRERKLLNARKGWILGTWKGREIETGKFLKWHRATRAYTVPENSRAGPRWYNLSLSQSRNRGGQLETVRTGDTLWINLQEHAERLPTYFYSGSNYGAIGELEPWMELDPELVFHLWSRTATNYQDTRDSERSNDKLFHYNVTKWPVGSELAYSIGGNATEDDEQLIVGTLREIETHLNWYTNEAEVLSLLQGDSGTTAEVDIHVKIPKEEWLEYLPGLASFHLDALGVTRAGRSRSTGRLVKIIIVTADHTTQGEHVSSVLQELYHASGLFDDYESHDLPRGIRSILDDTASYLLGEYTDLDKAVLALHGHYVIEANMTPEQAREALEAVGWFEQ